MPKYDVVIVGSGLGGLLCASILSREGMRICVIEKHSQIGGCLQTFTRDGCIFDTGVHYISSMDEGQILHRYFKYFGLIDKLNLRRLDEHGFDKICFNVDQSEFNYAMGTDNFVETLSKAFPKERHSIQHYAEKLKQICDGFDLYNLRVSATSSFETPHLMDNTFRYLQSVSRDVKLQNVLAGINLLYAGIASKTPLYVHALINYSYIQSAYRLVDGSSQIAEHLEESIRSHGGEILRNHGAKAFLFRNDVLSAVECTNGERLEANYFISNIHPARTLELISPDKIRRIYRERINSLENTTSTFILYISLKKNSLEYQNYNYYLYNDVNVWPVESPNGNEWPANLFFFTPATSRSDIYAESLIVMSYMKFNEVRRWERTTIENRGEEYRQFKRDKVETILDMVEHKLPGLRSKIQSVHTSSPLTLRDYTGTTEGSMYGIIRDSNEPYRCFVSHKTKIPNLLLTGQNTTMHGVLGVTIGSVVTCSDLLGLKYLVDSINGA